MGGAGKRTENTMKLAKVTSNDPVKRQAVSMHQSVLQRLEHYRVHYHSVHGDEISLSLLVEEICKRFMHDDRDFQKFLAAEMKKAEAPAAAQLAGQSTTLRLGAKV